MTGMLAEAESRVPLSALTIITDVFATEILFLIHLSYSSQPHSSSHRFRIHPEDLVTARCPNGMMGSTTEAKFNVKDIAVIGAGPCGLAALKGLVGQETFNDIAVYEQQPDVGGVWYYSEEPSDTLHVPQVDPFCPPDPPLRAPGMAPIFPTPMYDLLHANIPAPLMQFGDQAFPEDSLVFPSRQYIQEYLVRYSRDVRHLIKFSEKVTGIRLRQEGGRDVWDVYSESTLTGETSSRTFDAVVVASGHYSTIYIPDIPNIAEFNKVNPGVITHSKLYRSPSPYADKKVVVVGNSASGLDIASQISEVCRSPLLLSVRTPTPPTAPVNPGRLGCEELPVIEEFIPHERSIRFSDGRVETNIDVVMFATGYLFTAPFLQSIKPPLLTDGRRIYGLWKDLVHIEHPTLCFTGLPIKVVPFPLAQSQAAIFARVWSNTLELPSKEEMRAWEKLQARERGEAYHVYPKGGDVSYINGTYDWILQASSGGGKEPPEWDAELRWMRKIYAECKRKFEETGRTARSLEELGFVYTPEPQDPPAQEFL